MNKPIKRNDALAQFSREHHHGLLLAWKVRFGIKNDILPYRIANYILFFFEQALQPHFFSEETNVFPLLITNDTLRIRAENEHASIRALIDKIRLEKTNLKLAEEFAHLLDAHIRFEERELFEHIQNTIPEELIVNASINVHPDIHPEEKIWADMFWLKSNNNPDR